jgi:hypothetical protein
MQEATAGAAQTGHQVQRIRWERSHMEFSRWKGEF